MDTYDPFARLYDAVTGDPEPRLAVIRQVMARHCPQARSVLELGCGTGAILGGLADLPDRTGVDRSREMLRVAAAQARGATFVLGDMTRYRAARQFDVVLCVYDSLNHLRAVDAWAQLFERTAEHLTDGGIFHFDVNTVGRLRHLASLPAWTHEFDGRTLLMDVQLAPAPSPAHVRTDWHVRVVERNEVGAEILHETSVTELGVPMAELLGRLERWFTVLESVDAQGSEATDGSDRAYVTCTPRSS